MSFESFVELTVVESDVVSFVVYCDVADDDVTDVRAIVIPSVGGVSVVSVSETPAVISKELDAELLVDSTSVETDVVCAAVVSDVGDDVSDVSEVAKSDVICVPMESVGKIVVVDSSEVESGMFVERSDVETSVICGVGDSDVAVSDG